MNWTTEKPTVPGWYWMRRLSGDETIIEISKPWKDLICRMIGVSSMLSIEIADKACSWYGPIEVPK